MIVTELLPETYFKSLESLVLSSDFPWYYNDETVPNAKAFQFTHTIMRDGNSNSNYYELFKPIIYFIELKYNVTIKSVDRIKLNLRTKTLEEYEVNDGVHQDFPTNQYKTVLLYMNDSDGDTCFFDSDLKKIIRRVTPKRNSAIIFDSNMWHSSSAPKKTKSRVVINITVEVI